LKRGRKLTCCPWLAENVWQQLSWRTRVVFNLAQKRQQLNVNYVYLTDIYRALPHGVEDSPKTAIQFCSFVGELPGD
jgi:hypothetical protein